MACLSLTAQEVKTKETARTYGALLSWYLNCLAWSSEAICLTLSILSVFSSKMASFKFLCTGKEQWCSKPIKKRQHLRDKCSEATAERPVVPHEENKTSRE